MPDGAYGTTVKAGLAPGEIRRYYLNAEEGQQLTATLQSAENTGYLSITDSQGRSLLKDMPDSVQVRSLDIIFPQSGRYLLAVGSREGPCSYLLEVNLDWPADTNPDGPLEGKESPGV